MSALTLTATSSFGQFTPEQIDSLREVGRREGWTFTISDTALVHGSIENLCGFGDHVDSFPIGSRPMPTSTLSDTPLPSRFDWRDYVKFPPARDQGNCGSCWAFAAVGELECSIAIRDALVVDLSEQYLVSCNMYGAGCSGGLLMASVFHLDLGHPACITDTCGGYGPVLEQDFPYQAADIPCQCPYIHQAHFSIIDCGFVGDAYSLDIPPVDEIKRAIRLYGPIWVCVWASDLWFYYQEGIFNVCEGTYGNHAVVLTGWDDNQGTEGVWFVRNSWGPGWGEDGYMRIEYNCSRIGEAANWIDYGLPGTSLWADSTCGWIPHEVSFQALSAFEVDSWEWDFGDGGSAFVQSPTHTFDRAGTYDISVQANSAGTLYTATRQMYIVALADTVKTTDYQAEPGSRVVVTLTANNSTPIKNLQIPVEFSGELDLRFDSCSTVGCRTEYFERQEYAQYDPWYGKKFTLRLISSDHDTSPDLAPGTGPVAKVYFTLPETASEGQAAAILLDGYDSYLPMYSGDVASYQIASVSGSVSVAGCCAHRGDADHNGIVDLEDIIYLIDWTFSGGLAPPCPAEADADGVPPVTIDDLVRLVGYVYKAGPTPAPCQ